jgi:hypothetical protein
MHCNREESPCETKLTPETINRLKTHHGRKFSVANRIGACASLAIVVVFLKTFDCRAGSTSVVAWGSDPFGYGTTNVPPGLSNVVAIASGDYHILALRSDSTVVAWGRDSDGQSNVPAGLSNVVAIAAGGRNSLALKNDGTVVAWGNDFTDPSAVPLGLSNVVAIAGGWSHNTALKIDGTVLVWSSDNFNSGDLGATNVPAGLSNIVALAPGGAHHCLVLKEDGTEFGWGDNNAGSVTGTPSAPPYAAGQAIVDGQVVSNIVALAAGNHPSLALKNDGTVAGWPDDMPVPAGLNGVMAIAAGVAKDLAVKSDGTVVAWGYAPAIAPPAGLSNVVAVGAGGDHCVALLNDELSTDGAPFIMQHPFSLRAGTGKSAVFIAGAVGTVPLSYQWQFNGTNIVTAKRSALLVTNVSFADMGSYQCIVSNAVGVVTSAPAMLLLERSAPRFDVVRPALQFTNGGFVLRLSELSGHGDVVIQASTNLVDWSPIFTNPPVVGILEVVDSSITNSTQRFYRAEER